MFLVLLLVEVDSPYELLPPQLHMLSESKSYRLQIFLLVLIKIEQKCKVISSLTLEEVAHTGVSIEQ
jgi:hypothetical protein